jgi:hypothetical protein
MKTGKRKRVQTADDMPSEPCTKLRKRVQTAGEMASEPAKKQRRKSQTADVSNSRRRVARRPIRGSAAGEQTADITDDRGHLDDEHRSVREREQIAECSAVDYNSDEAHSIEGEQVAQHSSVDNSNGEDSVRCRVCSASFTTQDVATPDTCDHTFCAACLQEWSQNRNTCPADNNMFNFILVRHHFGGEIITRIPVQPPNEQNERSLCCKYISRFVLLPAFTAAYFAAFYVAGQVVMAYFLSSSSMQ